MQLAAKQACFAAGTTVHTGEGLPQCFPVDTYVVTRDRQWIEIDRLDVGHWVLSRCEKTGQQDYRRVVKKFEHLRENIFAPGTPLYRIIIVTAEGKKDGLQATAEHPFWVNGLGWVKACELKPGQMLEICDPIGEDDCNRPEGQKAADVTLSGQRWQAKIESVCQDSESGLLYNIEVEDFHTYFVGCHGVWVHNKSPMDFNHLNPNPGPDPQTKVDATAQERSGAVSA